MNSRILMAVLFSAAVLSFSITASAKTKVELKNAEGKNVGTATIAPAKMGVNIMLDLHDMPAGQHAIHIHQNAKCEAPDFKSAGGHFNPDSKHHGTENPEGHHAGDMQNITVPESGKLKTTINNMDVNLGDDTHSVFSNGGTALVIHAKADDMKSDPAGNAGDRIACGTITK
ncbi:MAG TPA: superoxide dismutase family protein [Terriglobales bacterium]|nr:superoxide dismutase family protein [Terriglobales bacterium]